VLRFWISGVVIAIALSYILQFNNTPKKSGSSPSSSFSLFKGSPLNAKDLLKASSSSPDLKVARARLIIDNDAAFDSKLEAIRSARPGETIRLSYQSYSTDETSAIFFTELLNAASRGVHIRLMADLSMSSHNLDIFSYLETQGRGLFQIKLYSWPSTTLHHNVLIVENRFAQIGGRDIKNSHHLNSDPLTKKPIFVATDMTAEFSVGGESISKSFDRLWNLETLTKSLKDLNYRLTSSNLRKIASTLKSGVSRYNEIYLPQKSYKQTWNTAPTYSDLLSEKDTPNLFLTYVENLPFDQSKNDTNLTPHLTSVAGQELKFGKNIHHLFYKGLENACATSIKEGKEKRVIFHSSLLLPPAVLLRGFSKMLNGTWDCHKVRVTLLTNSTEPPNSSFKNIALRHVMTNLFQTAQNKHQIYGEISSRRSAKFESFEYQNSPKSSEPLMHTAANVLGNDLFIGSANADLKSYYMGTNNGFFVRGAKELTDSYIAYIDRLIGDNTKMKELTSQFSDPSMTSERLYSEDLKIHELFMNKQNSTNKLSLKTKEKDFKSLHSFVNAVSDATLRILTKEENQDTKGSNTEADFKRLQSEAQQEADQQYDQLLRIL